MDNLIEKYGKGASLLLRMGYIPGRGLGSKNQGIVEPITPVLREKGQGIKVNKMKSRIVDDWSGSDDDEVHETVPLGFSKSGDDVPDLWSLIHELRSLKIDFPKEVLEMDGEPVPVRKHLWQILKDGQSKKFKSDYLNAEITNLEKSINETANEYTILRKVFDLSNEPNYDVLLQYVIELDLLKVSGDAKEDILNVVVSKISELWTNAIEGCDFTNLESFTQLIELGEKFSTSVKKLSSSVTNFIPDRDSSKISRVHLGLLESMLLVPLFHKLETFYHEWDPSNVNLGIGIFEELVIDRKLFSSDIIQRVIVDNMIIPKLIGYMNGGGEPSTLIEWFTVISDSSSSVKLLNSVFDCYIEKFANGYKYYAKIKQWMDILPAKEAIFSKRVFIELLVKIVDKYRVGVMFDYDNVIEFLKDCEDLTKAEAFNAFNEKDIVCLSVIENELVINLINELMKVSHDEQVEFWKYWTNIINQKGFLKFEVLKDIRYGWQFINIRHGLNLTNGKSTKFDKNYNVDIMDVINKGIGSHNMSTEASNEINISMKDIVMIECEKKSISIIPSKVIKLGIKTFKIGNELNIYFKDNVIWGSRNGDEYLPMSLEEIF